MDATLPLIRSAVARDLPALLSLYLQLNPADPPLDNTVAEARFAEILAQRGMSILVAEIDGEVTSTITLVVIPNLTRNGMPYALIENVVTDHRFRRRGHSRALILAAFRQAWEMGCYKVMLLTGSSDPATLKFYEGCGFQQNKTGYQIRRPADI